MSLKYILNKRIQYGARKCDRSKILYLIKYIYIYISHIAYIVYIDNEIRSLSFVLKVTYSKIHSLKNCPL